MITDHSLSSSSAVDIDFGSNVTLSCTSSGSPPDTFTWMKDGVPVTQYITINELTYDDNNAVFSSNYTISNFSLTNNGTYTCTVTNPIGSDNYSIIVNIRKFLCFKSNIAIYIYIYIYMVRKQGQHSFIIN